MSIGNLLALTWLNDIVCSLAYLVNVKSWHRKIVPAGKILSCFFTLRFLCKAILRNDKIKPGWEQDGQIYGQMQIKETRKKRPGKQQTTGEHPRRQQILIGSRKMARRKQMIGLRDVWQRFRMWAGISIFGWDECRASLLQQLAVRTWRGRRFEVQGLGQVRTTVRAGSRLRFMGLNIYFPWAEAGLVPEAGPGLRSKVGLTWH